MTVHRTSPDSRTGRPTCRSLALVALAVASLGACSASGDSVDAEVRGVTASVTTSDRIDPPSTVEERATSTTGVSVNASAVDISESLELEDLRYRPRRAGGFHPLGSGGDVVTVRTGPGALFAAVDEVAGGQVVLHGGGYATMSDGSRWVNLVDPGSKAELGWVPESLVGSRIRSVQVRAADGSAALTAHPGGWASGVDIEPPAIVGIGCDAVQVEVRSAASHAELSSHFLVGSKRPTAPREDWEDPVWSLGDDQQMIYIPPGESVIVTLPAVEERSYFFLALDHENRSSTAFDYAWEPVLTPHGELTASGTHEVSVAGACDRPG